MNPVVTIRLICILLLAPLLGVAQSSLKNNYNTWFDGAVRNDTTIKVVRVAEFPFTGTTRNTGHIVYNPEMNLWDNEWRAILDNPGYGTEEKIQFINDALADTGRDALKYISSRSINFWRQQPEAAALVHTYFQQKIAQNQSDVLLKNRYLEFVAKNMLPGSYEAIRNYFDKRDSTAERFYFEGDLIFRLVPLGHEMEALQLLEKHVDEFNRGKIHGVPMGYAPDSTYTLEYLCFSADKFIRKRSREMLFAYLMTYNDYSAKGLAAYLDPKRTAAIYKKHFDTLVALDFSKVKLEELGYEKGKKTFREAHPLATTYAWFVEGNSYLLGKYHSRAFWKEFRRRTSYLVNFNGLSYFYSLQNNVVRSCFQDSTLTQKERQAMIWDMYYTEEFMKDYRYADQKVEIMSWVTQLFPDKEIQARMIKGFGVSSYEINDYESQQPGKPKDLKTVAGDIRNAGLPVDSTHLRPLELAQYRFSQIYSNHWKLVTLLQQTGRIVHFDAETGFVPVNYAKLFAESFRPVLGGAGLHNFQVVQQHDSLGKELYRFRIYLKSGDEVYLHEFTEEFTDWYSPQRLVKMINLALANSGKKERMIEISSMDQTAIFGLFEPARLIPLLKKYGLTANAVTWQDEN
jgi:hypothetical protein